MSSAPQSRRQFLARLLAGAVAAPSISCGTLLHPERQGLRSGRLDPAIVVLDAVGLLFFFVPGIIAFAVDFATGAIYLPPDEFGYIPQGGVAPQQLRRVDTGNSALDRRQVEAVVLQQTGRTIDLDAADVRVSNLESIDEFSAAAARLSNSPMVAR